MVFGDAAMRMCATISWFMAGATEADQRAMGTWTSALFHLYNMAPLEHMAFLQLHANAAQFTTANSLRKTHRATRHLGSGNKRRIPCGNRSESRQERLRPGRPRHLLGQRRRVRRVHREEHVHN